MSDEIVVKDNAEKDTFQVLETIIEDTIATLEAHEVDSSSDVVDNADTSEVVIKKAVDESVRTIPEENIKEKSEQKFGEGPYPLVGKDQAKQSGPVEEILVLKRL